MSGKSKKAARKVARRQRLVARLKAPLSIISYTPGICVDKNKKTILIISHEASRTGAPILALNIAKKFAGKYNVISFLLRGGELKQDFLNTSVAVVDYLGSKGNKRQYFKSIKQLLSKQKVFFAIVNSIESRSVLESLSVHGVPNITLVHEFVSYTRDKEAPLHVARLTNKIVFSADIVRDSALYASPEISLFEPLVIPQGRCDLIDDNETDVFLSEKQRLIKAFYPDGNTYDFTVIGSGTVHIRKGVDIFISAAKRINELYLPKGSIRFVWIGEGYEPESDYGYSCYLEDQILRSGLEKIVSIIPPTPYIKAAYELSDLMLMVSRLDPLPNVAIDGICMGMPVLCFDRATGIAGLLKDSGLGDDCVARYMDVEDLSRKVVNILNSKAKRHEIRRKSLALANECFVMDKYIDQLDFICLNAVKKTDD